MFTRAHMQVFFAPFSGLPLYPYIGGSPFLFHLLPPLTVKQSMGKAQTPIPALLD